MWAVQIDFVSVWGIDLTWVQRLDRNWLAFCGGVQKYLVLASGSKLTWFFSGGIEIDFSLERGSKWHDFSGGVEINVFVWGVEFDFFLVVASKLTCFLCGGSKLTMCRANWLVFRAVIDWLGFCVSGRNWPVFRIKDKSLGVSLCIEIDLVFAWVIEIDFISVWGIGPL